MVNTTTNWDEGMESDLGANLALQKTGGNREWALAGMTLDNLLAYQEEVDEATKILVEQELYNRYHPCVRGKNDEIQMNPHYRNDRSWIVSNNVWHRYRTCVTYEDPNSPNPQTSIDTDRIANNYEVEAIDNASQVANEQAQPRTAKWWEIYFSTLTKKDIQVNRILTGIRPDGYAWNRIGYSEIENPVTDDVKGQIDTALKYEET